MAKVLGTENVCRRKLGAIVVTGVLAGKFSKASAKPPVTEAADATVSKLGQGNILPNVQWQVWSALAGAFWNVNDKAWRLYCITKMNRQGTGTQYPIVCDGFDVSNNNPTFHTNNTQQLKNGDLVLIEGGGFQWGYDGPGYISTPTAVRVVNLVPDTSFEVVAPLGGVTPSSVLSGVTARPICPGDLGQIGTGNAADGWKKTPSMTVWADDFAENACAGAIRTMGVCKDQSATETLNWTCPSAQVPKYQGRVVSFGALVYPKSAQGRNNTWRPYIFESVSGLSGYHYPTVDAVDETYSPFQFASVTATVPMNAAEWGVGIEFGGNAMDIYYVAIPTAVLGSELTVYDCHQNVIDELTPIGHWNPPLLTPLAMTFNVGVATGLYGWKGIDLEAISLGVCHKSVSQVHCKIELTTSSPGSTFLTGSDISYLSFGPQVTTQVTTRIGGVVQGVMNSGSDWLPLANDGTFAIFTGTGGLVVTNATFDFDRVKLSTANYAH